MSVYVETPPILTGTTGQQLQQTYSYLYRLSEYLNVALNQLPAAQSTVVTISDSGEEYNPAGDKKLAKTYNELRSLIINTAEIIRTEMDTLEAQLKGTYEALSSQFGSFEESFDTTITATAQNVVQQLNYESRLDALDSRAAGFESYQLRSEGYIRSGFVEYDEFGVPIVGIAIGQNLTATTVTVGGVEYEQLDGNQSCAFYTADRVSFRINGAEVAYISNRKLHIHDVEISGSVVLGGKWMLSTNGGFLVKWIGG